MGKLNARAVASAKAPGRYGDGRNLYLQVNDAEHKSWLLRYVMDGRERWMGLGPVADFTLAEARERARKARQMIRDGVDPLEARRAERRERKQAAARHLTFGEAWRQFFAQNAPKWRSQKTVVQFRQSMRDYAEPVLGRLLVADIEVADVLRALEQPHPTLREPLWQAIPESTDRLRRRIEKVLDWCTVRGHRTGPNPAQWKGRIEHVLPRREQVKKTEHYPALPYEAIPQFLAALRQREGVGARALEFLVLTAARSGEIMNAKWDQIDLEKRLWSIPGDEMKAQKPHRVPLPPRAVEILRDLPRERGNSHVFISTMKKGEGISDGTMSKVLKTLHEARAKAKLPPWVDRESGKLAVVHGFRSSFRDWSGETTGYANHVIEQALAHTVGSAVERAYRRRDLFQKRVRLMRDWGAYATSEPKASGDVVPMRSAAE